MLQFPIAMTPRTEPARALAWLSPVIAFALTVFTGFCLFAALGQDPVKALGVFFIASLDSLRGWTEIAVKMTPLLLCAAGLVVCFKANVWNIGAEGQLIAGAITGGVVALACDPSWGRWYVVLVMLASAVGGAVWGGFTALLRHRFHANEILVSLMLVYVAQFLLAWCVQGPMRDPMGFGFPQTKLFEAGAMLPVLEGTRLHAGALLALFSAVGVWLLMDRMALGFQFKVSGMAPFAARYAGYHPGKLIWASMLICGALAGLAGGIEASSRSAHTDYFSGVWICGHHCGLRRASLAAWLYSRSFCHGTLLSWRRIGAEPSGAAEFDHGRVSGTPSLFHSRLRHDDFLPSLLARPFG